MNRVKWLVAIFVVLGISACRSTGNPEEDIVITRIDNILPEILAEVQGDPHNPDSPAIIVNVEDIGNKLALDAVRKLMPDATTVVFTERQFLKEEFKSSTDLSQVINLTLPSVVDEKTGENKTDVAGTIGVLGGIVGTIFPPAAPFLPLLGLFPWAAKKRSRTHLKDAVKKITPYDGKIDLVGSVKAISKAFGLDHTTDNPEELERVAKKLRVKTAAKNGGLESMHATLAPQEPEEKAS